MKPEFGAPLPGDFAGRPRHISAIDFVLWNRLRRTIDISFIRLFFDVAVGAGAPGGAGVSDNVIKAWNRVTRQRIDVVGEMPRSWTIIEIRGAAGPGAIGSLMVYRDLWLEDPPDNRPLNLWLVTDIFPENLRPSLEKSGIRLILV